MTSTLPSLLAAARVALLAWLDGTGTQEAFVAADRAYLTAWVDAEGRSDLRCHCDELQSTKVQRKD